MKNRFGIYIHFPFCKRVCYYCHFTKQKFDPELSKRYVSSILKELSLIGDKNKTIDTVYFGGGSPGLIDPKDIDLIFNSISKKFSLQKKNEITIEINPEDVGPERLKIYRKIGFNRISIGIQSFEPNDLNFLKRSHNSNLSVSVLKDAIKSGFNNINADFIIGLPDQTEETLLRGFKIVKDLKIPHISVYILEGVKEENETEHQFDESLFFKSESILKNFDYFRYEVSNYALQDFESIHNNKYWKNREYIGIGISASGYTDGIDYKNTEDLKEYISLLEKGILPIKEKNRIDPIERKIITGLRRTKGIELKNFDKHKDKLNVLLKEKILFQSGNYISISPDKILLLNEILGYFR